MNRLIIATLGSAMLMAGVTAAEAQLVKQITISPGKGVSFFMGGQQGTAVFAPVAGACGLTVSISQMPAPAGMSGMAGMAGGMSPNGAKAASIRIQVMPGRPAHVDTPDGQQLVFNCGPDGQQMFLDMPTDFKYSEK